jgi:hypothetical protein
MDRNKKISSQRRGFQMAARLWIVVILLLVADAS